MVREIACCIVRGPWSGRETKDPCVWLELLKRF